MLFATIGFLLRVISAGFGVPVLELDLGSRRPLGLGLAIRGVGRHRPSRHGDVAPITVLAAWMIDQKLRVRGLKARMRETAS
jgi:hypothetical protein